MKNSLILLITALFLVFSTNSYSQNKKAISNIKAKKAHWVVQKKILTISQALKGVNVRNQVKLVVELQPQTLLKAGEANQKFEIKWYQYGSRGLYLTDSFVETINFAEKAKKKEAINITSTRKNVQAGWWIVKITSYSDNGFVTLDGKTQFKIKVL